MAKLKSLENKVVWITGASSGLGKALARECARTRCTGGFDFTPLR